MILFGIAYSYMKVCLGGTFDYIHEGHKALLRKAFEIGDEIYIGVSTDDFVKKSGKMANPYEERVKKLRKFITENRWNEKAKILPLDDIYGSAIYEEFDAIVVSPETEKRAKEINKIREEKGLKKLEIIVVPYVLAEDGIPIASSRIRNGEIDGIKRLKPLKVCVASRNRIKMESVKRVFKRLFDFEINYFMNNVETKKQPFNEEIMEWAIKRANSCQNCDYCIGIEAGVREEGGIYFIEQYVAIRDKTSYMTYGKSPSFQCPDWLFKKLKEGMEMKNAIPFKRGEEDKGAIWYFSHRMERIDLTELGIFMAMVPRLYGKL